MFTLLVNCPPTPVGWHHHPASPFPKLQVAQQALLGGSRAEKEVESSREDKACAAWFQDLSGQVNGWSPLYYFTKCHKTEEASIGLKYEQV